jgi:1-deoxy-D-xylulose-5-phosphate synthase
LPIYNRFKNSLENLAKSRLPKGSRVVKLANQFEESLKGLFIPGIFFEELGFRYFGPLDGHNLNLLVPTLKNIAVIKGPLLLHVVTKKGKGYLPAEDEPVRFHSTGPFDIGTGQSAAKVQAASHTFTDAFSNKLIELAKANKKIVAITAAMPEGTGLDKFRDLFPERFFDVGIAESHAVCFAAGLARNGLRPVVAIYSTFLQRAYDQIMEEVALQGLPVILAVDRSGIVGEDGVTHQGIFDLSFLRTVPNLTIMAPKDCAELAKMLEFAFTLDGPAVIRYPKASSMMPEASCAKIEPGKSEILKDGEDFTLIALGSMVAPSLEALALLEKEGFRGTLINARFVKPLDAGLFNQIDLKARPIFTIEEGIVNGGFGSAVSDCLNSPVVKLGLPCEFITHGKRNIILEKYGLTAEGIADKIKSVIKKGALNLK